MELKINSIQWFISKYLGFCNECTTFAYNSHSLQQRKSYTAYILYESEPAARYFVKSVKKQWEIVSNILTFPCSMLWQTDLKTSNILFKKKDIKFRITCCVTHSWWLNYVKIKYCLSLRYDSSFSWRYLYGCSKVYLKIYLIWITLESWVTKSTSMPSSLSCIS